MGKAKLEVLGLEIMPKVKLEVLDLEVPTGLFTVYHDDGFVSDVYRHEEILNEIYKVDDSFLSFREKFLGIELVGQCCVRRRLLKKHVHICYLDLDDDSQNIEIRAHEETHALQELNQIDSLEITLREEQGINLSLDSLDREVVACIGGLFAMDKRGFSPCELSSYKADPRHREVARQLYEQSRVQGK